MISLDLLGHRADVASFTPNWLSGAGLRVVGTPSGVAKGFELCEDFLEVHADDYYAQLEARQPCATQVVGVSSAARHSTTALHNERVANVQIVHFGRIGLTAGIPGALRMTLEVASIMLPSFGFPSGCRPCSASWRSRLTKLLAISTTAMKSNGKDVTILARFLNKKP